MLRIYLSSSHLSAFFIALHAEKTFSKDCKDILIVESARIKKSHLELIHQTSIIHKWSEIHDFVSVMSDNDEMKTTAAKKITRKLKTKPIVKQIYNSLLDSKTEKDNNAKAERLKTIFKNDKYARVEMNMLTKTALNPLLIELFPNAYIRYFEHGLGDYIYIQESFKKDEFNCLFAEDFRKYLFDKNSKSEFISSSASANEFETASKKIISNLPNKDELQKFLKEKKSLVLILMESVEMYDVKQNFWSDYLNECIKQISDAKQFTFIIKPHPAQSSESIEITKSFFEKRNLAYHLLDHPSLSGVCAEVLFSEWKENTKHVFALFSSSLFYLSKLYPEPHITYHYSYEFMKKHIGNAPEQFKQHFLDLEELIEKVFSGNCKKFS